MVQRGDVNKTLLAGGSISDQGNTLLFTKYGGMIVKDPDLSIYKRAVSMAKVKTPFRRKGKTYAMNITETSTLDNFTNGRVDANFAIAETSTIDKLRCIFEY